MRLERINGGYSVAGENKFIEDYSCCSEEEAIEEATECLKCDLPIIVDESKCTGCLNCMIYCSLSKNGYHNPSESFIKIVSHDDGHNEISFLDDCVNWEYVRVFAPLEH